MSTCENTKETPQKFETETCTRCAGSGHFSYCMTHGTVCFKCKGRKVTLTKRGDAAAKYMNELRTVLATEVKPGWLIYADGFCGGKSGWSAVTVAEFGESKYKDQATGEWVAYFEIESNLVNVGNCADSTVLAVPNKERLAETRQLALEYQQTLTEAGIPPRDGGAGQGLVDF